MSLYRMFIRCKNVVTPSAASSRLEICKFSDKSQSERKIEEPIKFATSRAATWKAEFSRQGAKPNENIPPYQGIVVSLSVGVFLLYFCVLREENDLDEELEKTLYDRIEGLEEMQLQQALKYNLDKGLDTHNIRERLRQLTQEKSAET